MDPNACLRRIEDALTDSEWQEACDAARDLDDWRAGGGFEPQWENYMNAANFYRAFTGEDE